MWLWPMAAAAGKAEWKTPLWGQLSSLGRHLLPLAIILRMRVEWEAPDSASQPGFQAKSAPGWGRLGAIAPSHLPLSLSFRVGDRRWGWADKELCLREALAVCTPPAPEPSAKRPGS